MVLFYAVLRKLIILATSLAYHFTCFLLLPSSGIAYPTSNLCNEYYIYIYIYIYILLKLKD